MNIKAQPFLEKAYEADSTNNNIIYCLAIISNEMADYGHAVKYFSTLIKRVIPSDMIQYLYYRGLGNSYKGCKDMQSFIYNFEKVSEYVTDSQKMTLYYDMATVYEENLKNKDEALVYYDKYRNLLNKYLDEMKTKSDVGSREEELKSVENKINYLESHIQILKANKD